jgi:hypothetical protein
MRHRSAALLTVLLAFSIAALAVTPQFWEHFSQDDLLAGTLTRVSLSSDGKLFPAPAYDMVYDTDAPFIFSMARDKVGNVYLGTGHEGKVFKVDAQGKGSLYYQSKELDIFALAVDAADNLYVGTSPDGKVYKVTAANQATEFCNPEEKYIWAMSFDDSGNLYVGTGGHGNIFKVDRAGKKTTFYAGKDTHIVCLARESNGNLLAGTSPGGVVIEITPQGKGFTMLDTSMAEVRSIVVDRLGTIYAVASGSSASAGLKNESLPAIAPATALPIATIQALANLADKSKTGASAVTAPGGEKDSSGSRSSIYAISRDGNTETVYSSKDQMIFDIALRNDGSIIAATGPKGRLLAIDAAKQVTVVTDSPEEDMTRLLEGSGFTWVAGSNQGKLYKLQSRQAETGTFESKVLDAKAVSTWGKISWGISNPAGAKIEISTRTGNTDKPDNSWSDWSSPYEAEAGQQITSPRARYLQWRYAFKGAGAAGQKAAADLLEKITIPYLQQNLRPQVVGINALPGGIGLQKTPSISAGTVTVSSASTATDGLSLNSPRSRGKETLILPPRQILQAGAQSFTWKATDDNDDSLEYAIYFKGEGESEWKVLEQRSTDTFYTLDSVSLPGGVYRLKVVASDAPSNPYGRFLIGELVSNPFVISNTTPLVEIKDHKISSKSVEIQFSARVPAGRIITAEFSLDGGEWFLVFPQDGIADSVQEEFRFATPDLSLGEHLIGVRASDEDGNTGTAKLLVKIP